MADERMAVVVLVAAALAMLLLLSGSFGGPHRG